MCSWVKVFRIIIDAKDSNGFDQATIKFSDICSILTFVYFIIHLLICMLAKNF
jgi:hypothetical protein